MYLCARMRMLYRRMFVRLLLGSQMETAEEKLQLHQNKKTT